MAAEARRTALTESLDGPYEDLAIWEMGKAPGSFNENITF